MDTATLAIYLATTFVGGIVTGLAGFAMGLVVSGVWLHIMTPVQAAALIVGYGLVMQTWSLWKLRRALDLRAIAPFVLGGVFGTPLGAWLLTYVPSDSIRLGVGALLVVYSLYGLARPHVSERHAPFAVDTGVGFVNGILGGLTGLAGPIITMWCQIRGWPKDKQRAIFQPVILVSFTLTAISFGLTGKIDNTVTSLFLIGLPIQFTGVLLGLRLYGKLDEARFRLVILVLLLISGIVLLIPWERVAALMQ